MYNQRYWIVLAVLYRILTKYDSQIKIWYLMIYQICIKKMQRHLLRFILYVIHEFHIIFITIQINIESNFLCVIRSNYLECYYHLDLSKVHSNLVKSELMSRHHLNLVYFSKLHLTFQQIRVWYTGVKCRICCAELWRGLRLCCKLCGSRPCCQSYHHPDHSPSWRWQSRTHRRTEGIRSQCRH